MKLSQGLLCSHSAPRSQFSGTRRLDNLFNGAWAIINFGKRLAPWSVAGPCEFLDHYERASAGLFRLRASGRCAQARSRPAPRNRALTVISVVINHQDRRALTVGEEVA